MSRSMNSGSARKNSYSIAPTQPTLETERLILRSLVLDDEAAIQKAASAREVASTTISIPHPYPDGEAQRYIANRIAEFQLGRTAAFTIEYKPLRSFIGLIEIRDIESEHAQAELSYWLAVEAWGQGYMSEAVKPMLRFGFENLELNRIYAYHMLRNPASSKVLQKNGFVPEGVLRQRVRKWNVFEDVALLAILRQDWNKQTR